jgi:hypothetical protein
MTSPQTRRQQNILNDLSRKKAWFGIPYAYCAWYLDNPQYKDNPLFSMLYDKMLSLNVDTELLKMSAVAAKKKAEDSFHQSHTFLEDRLVPAGMKEQLTPEEVARSYRIGMCVGGTMVLLILLYLVRQWTLGLL